MACMEGYIITLITFLHFPFSNVSSRCLHNWTKNCINYNSFDFLRYGFSMVSPWHFYQSTKSHTNCICLINTRAPDGVLGVSEFCCKSEIKENWKVIWQKPRESRSLGSLGVSNCKLYYSQLMICWSWCWSWGWSKGRLYGLGDVISHEKRNLMLIVGWHNIWPAPYKSHPGSLKQYHSQHSINYKRGKRHGLGFANSIKTTFGLMIFLKSFTLQF